MLNALVLHFHLQILSAFLLTEFTIFDIDVSVLNIRVDCNWLFSKYSFCESFTSSVNHTIPLIQRLNTVVLAVPFQAFKKFDNDFPIVFHVSLSLRPGISYAHPLSDISCLISFISFPSNQNI
jgi:hypothetical protein